MLEVKVEQCAGIDVGKKIIEVCVLIGPANRKPAGEVRRFGSNVGNLEALRAWLKEKACTEVVMESTGSYWKPVFNILEGHLPGDPGQSGAGQSPSRQEDGSYRLPMVSGVCYGMGWF